MTDNGDKSSVRITDANKSEPINESANLLDEPQISAKHTALDHVSPDRSVLSHFQIYADAWTCNSF